MGATNRIRDIDQAVLRRMPKQYPLYLPDTAQRERILRLVSWLGNATLASNLPPAGSPLPLGMLADLYSPQMLADVPLAPNFSMQTLAEFSWGKSGSDLKEMCRNASMLPVRELLRQADGDVALIARMQDKVRTPVLPVDLFGDLFCTGL